MEERAFSTTKGTTCPVCCEDFLHADLVAVVPRCGHLFHGECLDDLVANKFDNRVLRDGAPLFHVCEKRFHVPVENFKAVLHVGKEKNHIVHLKHNTTGKELYAIAEAVTGFPLGVFALNIEHRRIIQENDEKMAIFMDDLLLSNYIINVVVRGFGGGKWARAGSAGSAAAPPAGG